LCVVVRKDGNGHGFRSDVGKAVIVPAVTRPQRWKSGAKEGKQFAAGVILSRCSDCCCDGTHRVFSFCFAPHVAYASPRSAPVRIGRQRRRGNVCGCKKISPGGLRHVASRATHPSAPGGCRTLRDAIDRDRCSVYDVVVRRGAASCRCVAISSDLLNAWTDISCVSSLPYIGPLPCCALQCQR
jgi:hypothetical protein